VFYSIVNIFTLVACIIAFVSLRKVNLMGKKSKMDRRDYKPLVDDQNATGSVLLNSVRFVIFSISCFAPVL